MLGHYPRAVIRGNSDVLLTTHFLGSLNPIALTGVRAYIPCSCRCALNEEAKLEPRQTDAIVLPSIPFSGHSYNCTGRRANASSFHFIAMPAPTLLHQHLELPLLRLRAFTLVVRR